MVGATLQRFGRLDHAFLNAGVGGAFGPIEQILHDQLTKNGIAIKTFEIREGVIVIG